MYPVQKADESEQAFMTRVSAWLDTVQKDGDRDELLHSIERRMVRIETRATNALRLLGVHPGKAGDVMAGVGEVLAKDNTLWVTSTNVPIGEVARAAVLTGWTGEIQIVVNNRPWGTINLK